MRDAGDFSSLIPCDGIGQLTVVDPHCLEIADPARERIDARAHIERHDIAGLVDPLIRSCTGRIRKMG